MKHPLCSKGNVSSGQWESRDHWHQMLTFVKVVLNLNTNMFFQEVYCSVSCYDIKYRDPVTYFQSYSQFCICPALPVSPCWESGGSSGSAAHHVCITQASSERVEHGSPPLLLLTQETSHLPTGSRWHETTRCLVQKKLIFSIFRGQNCGIYFILMWHIEKFKRSRSLEECF